MAQAAFLPSDYSFAPTNRVVSALEDLRDIVLKRLEMAAMAAADHDENHDQIGFDGAMRSVAAYKVVLDDIALRIMKEQRS